MGRKEVSVSKKTRRDFLQSTAAGIDGPSAIVRHGFGCLPEPGSLSRSHLSGHHRFGCWFAFSVHSESGAERVQTFVSAP